jgi:hypothetical protein
MGRMHAQDLDHVVGIIINSPAFALKLLPARMLDLCHSSTVPVVLVGQDFARTRP